MVHQHFLFDEPVLLIQPIHIGAKYTKDNLIFRSLVVDLNGNIVSPSFKKFFNDTERPDIDPLPATISSATAIEKVDGSTFIASLFKGNLVVRTRGTVDASNQENAHEFAQLTEKYKLKEILVELNKVEPTTLLFEITSPIQRIVVDYGYEPELWLTGAVRHNDYSYFTQDELDSVANKYCLRRPRRYYFSTLEELSETVKAFRGVEGICLYYHNDQCIRKFKSIHYLYLHRAKSDVSSLEKVMDLYLAYMGEIGHTPSYQEFFAYLEKMFDYEIATMAISNVSQIADAMKEVDKILDGMKEFIAGINKVQVGSSIVELSAKQTRKYAADRIMQAYGSTGRTSMLFKLLDNKSPEASDYKKLLFQCLKN